MTSPNWLDRYSAGNHATVWQELRQLGAAVRADADESYDERDRRVIETVLEHGWQVMLVAENADCADPDHHDHATDGRGETGPAFAYTVGLRHRAGHPELLMSGLDHRLMHRALNGVARDHARAAPRSRRRA